MARKRGGLAGFYDRNKGAIKALAPAALSFIPGVGIPLAAAAGAALGADTEGRKFFDTRNIGGAVKGGLTGAAVGAGTQGVRGLLTGGGSFGGKMAQAGESLKKMGVKGVLKGARENKDLIGMAAKGIQSAMPDQANEAALMNAETARQRLAMEQGEMDEARRIREARAESTRRLLAPYIDQYTPTLRNYLNG